MKTIYIEKKIAPVRWFGGKGNLKAWIYSFFPEHKVYVEAFGGGGCLLFYKRPSPVEVYNDLDDRLVNLFRVLQNRKDCAEFYRRLRFTLYSRSEFAKALQILKEQGHDNITKAWAFFVAQNQGFGGEAKSLGNWGRAFVSNAGMAHTTSRWITRINMIPWWRERLMRVQIDNRCALQVIKYWDSPDTFFYLDPPYVHETRTKGHLNVYAHEPDNTFHEQLIDTVLSCRGKFLISGYDHPIYKRLESRGFSKAQKLTACHAAGRIRISNIRNGTAPPRTECVWFNYEHTQCTSRNEEITDLFNTKK